ncbi:hypothetical protein [Mycobacterium malmoense]|uniref:hypothetical protein n=1 Tax=Mycobacterium malmoense TaxID=1780 RepID=UPI001428BC76|nr:hypothetical protein [Mycobacterium malmoense]
MNFTFPKLARDLCERRAATPHRCFLRAKHSELTLGPASVQPAHLGATYSEGLP